MTPLLSLLLSLAPSSVFAWNTDVHNQIGFMAETLLNPLTTTTLSSIIPPPPHYNSSIGLSASWADFYAHTPEGSYSYPWHWIDTHDSPPTSCNLTYPSDCSPHGCIVSALVNQTTILKSCIADIKKENRDSVVGAEGVKGGEEKTNETCAMALKWITHFIGDIHQPLHASGKAQGGNTINVTFGGLDTELHAVWDGYIIYLAAGGVHRFSNTTLAPYMSNLLSRIADNDFLEPVEGWVRCVDPEKKVEECVVGWARESNKWSCEFVYGELPEQGTDLVESGYAGRAVPIVEMQVVKAAVRLGVWLNALVEREFAEDEDGEEEEGGYGGQAVLESGGLWEL